MSMAEVRTESAMISNFIVVQYNPVHAYPEVNPTISIYRTATLITVLYQL